MSSKGNNRGANVWGSYSPVEELPHPADTEPAKPAYVKPEGHNATGLIYTPALHAAGHINLENVRDDVYQEEEAQAARDAAKEQQ